MRFIYIRLRRLLAGVPDPELQEHIGGVEEADEVALLVFLPVADDVSVHTGLRVAVPRRPGGLGSSSWFSWQFIARQHYVGPKMTMSIGAIGEGDEVDAVERALSSQAVPLAVAVDADDVRLAVPIALVVVDVVALAHLNHSHFSSSSRLCRCTAWRRSV